MPHAKIMPYALHFIPYATHDLTPYDTMHPLPPIMPNSFYDLSDISSTPTIWLHFSDSLRTWLFWCLEKLQCLVASGTSTTPWLWQLIHHNALSSSTLATRPPQCNANSEPLAIMPTMTSCQLWTSGHPSLLTPGHPQLSDMLSYPDIVSTLIPGFLH